MKILLLSAPGMNLEMPIQHLRASYSVPHIGVNQLIELEIRKLTKLGQQAESLRAAGQPIGDDLILGMIRRQVRRSAAKNGFILQGFPTQVSQAQALDELLQASEQALQVALWLAPAGVPPQPVEDPLFAYYRASGRLRVLALPADPETAAAALDTVFDKFAAGILPKARGVAKRTTAVLAPATASRTRAGVKKKVARVAARKAPAPKRAAPSKRPAPTPKRPVGRPPKQAAAPVAKRGRPPGSVTARAGVKKRRAAR